MSEAYSRFQSSVRTIEPILNARMKNLSNFSFRERGRASVGGIGDRFAVIDSGGHPLEGIDKEGCCNAGERVWRRGTLCRESILSTFSPLHC